MIILARSIECILRDGSSIEPLSRLRSDSHASSATSRQQVGNKQPKQHGPLSADRSSSKRSPLLYRHQALPHHLLSEDCAACRVQNGPFKEDKVD
ncbi:hypothetical protein THAOC_12846 [Thalassiosira oceanica]|uniref:Uncharacterized protein n=1 Tax=Thalassiosira oceanica TaxID=159749 RepID=K0T759_THAOC|nr:hypothetical protein THAOC_12846 [Thalassiosira oceanica]|eukprot:EJK66247.1 hypothetical protein THAOC_12846 [Thalassiosira oceanica]